MKRTLFFTSLSVATGITILELIIFFKHFSKLTQKNLDHNMKILANNTYKYIDTNFDHSKVKYDIYKLKVYIDDIHKISKQNNITKNNELVLKSIMLIFLLITSILLSYVTLENKDINKEYFGIFLGIITGALTQYFFVYNFVFKYHTASQESLLNYVLDRVSNIIKIC